MPTVEERCKADLEIIPTAEERYKAGEQGAFEELWIQHRADFENWARRHTRCEHHASDLLQETATKLLTTRVRDQYDSTQPWRAWAFTVLRNTATDFHRKRVRSKEISLDAEVRAAVPTSNSDLASDLDDCLRRLNPQSRKVVDLRFVQGMKGDGIAAEIGCSESSVSRRWEKARRHLADCLRKKGYGDSLQ
jgi:RNA polymerase sigma-70 factor (ECF subfamily)